MMIHLGFKLENQLTDWQQHKCFVFIMSIKKTSHTSPLPFKKVKVFVFYGYFIKLQLIFDLRLYLYSKSLVFYWLIGLKILNLIKNKHTFYIIRLDKCHVCVWTVCTCAVIELYNKRHGLLPAFQATSLLAW